MTAPNPQRPHTACPFCGYDMRPLLAAGIRRCPECGKTVPRSLFLHVESKHAFFYIYFLMLAITPAAIAIMMRLVLAAAHKNPLRSMREADLVAAVWLVLTPLYCYILTFVFCRAHRLPRASVGAIPVSVPVSLVNIGLAAAFLVRN